MSEPIKADFAAKVVQAPASGQCPKCGSNVLLVTADNIGPVLVEFDPVVVVRVNQKLHAPALTGRVMQGHLPHLCKPEEVKDERNHSKSS